MVACLGIAVSLSACGAAARYDYSKEPDPRKREFVLGASDRIRVTVWKYPDLSTDATVRPDGTVTLPLIGDIRAAGQTPGQLREETTRRLRNFVKDESAVVTIAVTEANSYRFTIAGNVERAGVFSAKYYVTVAEAVALAGGLNKFASPHRLVLTRLDGAGGSRKIPLDWERIVSGEHPEENLALMPGDTLFVP